MSSDPNYSAKVRILVGGAQLDIAPGGSITYDGGAVSLTAPAATGSTSTTPFGFSQAQADAIVTWIRALDARLKLMGIAA